MLDIKFIRENPDKVKNAIRNRNAELDVDYLLELDEKRRAKIKEVDDFRARQNVFADEIAKAKGDERAAMIAESKALKTRLADNEFELKAMEEEFTQLMFEVPNVPAHDVPVGKDESENKPVRTWGEIPQFAFEPKDHMALGEALDIIDTERAAKVTGARFNYLKGGAVRLEFALVQFVLDTLTDSATVKDLADSVESGYDPKPCVPVVPPVMIQPGPYARMGRLSPKDKDERYHIPQDDLYLIGSSEHTMGSMFMDEVLDESDLPIRMLGFSTCFRREAGSYGKDTRGILRVHQFDKLEIESFSVPEQGENEQKLIVAIQEHLMQQLKLPYQLVAICTGDMGGPDVRQFDIETWMPGQGRYRETHTSDYMGDYQARRLNTRLRRADGKMEFVHMNDATVFAIGRMLIAILENYQQEDGSVRVPEVLQKYMGGVKVIQRKVSL